MYRYLIFIYLVFSLFSCQNRIQKEFFTKASLVPDDFDTVDNPCKEVSSYIPDLEYIEHTPIKYIRMNFHIMCKADGSANFDEKSGRVFINQVMDAANDKLSRNKKMNLPVGNDTPVVPMRYRYVLYPKPDDPKDDGIYFHRDDDLYYMVAKGKDKNNFDSEVYHKYAVQKDSVLNVFVMTNHVDSLDSPTYVADGKGVGFGKWLKVTNWYHNTRDTIVKNGKRTTRYTKWNAIKLLHHEIGHCLGLRHTWNGNDGCDDTPNHRNCWNKGKTKDSPCYENWSNNFMDYNAHSSAWSPCQIGTIHYNMSRKTWKIRPLLERTWCTLDETKTIEISDTVQWLGAKDLEGNIIIKDGGQLTIRCAVSLPKGAKIVIHPAGKLILNGATLENDCGDQWKGIEKWSKKEQEGTLVLLNNPLIKDVENPIEID